MRIERRHLNTLVVVLLLGCGACASQTDTLSEGTLSTYPVGDPENTSTDDQVSFDFADPSSCSVPKWATLHHATTSSTELLYVNLNGSVKAVRTDGEEVWSWSFRGAPGARTLEMRVYDPAFPFVVRKDKVLAYINSKVIVLDAATGELIHSNSDLEWKPEVLKVGLATVWSDDRGVHVATDGNEDVLNAAELYACGDAPEVLIVNRDGEPLTVRTDGAVEVATVRGYDAGETLGFYMFAPGVFGEVIYHEHVIYDDGRCWRVDERPSTVRPRSWTDYRPNYVTSTRHGHGYAVLRKSSKTRGGTRVSSLVPPGTLQFLPFESSREIQPCRRVSQTLVMPDFEL